MPEQWTFTPPGGTPFRLNDGDRYFIVESAGRGVPPVSQQFDPLLNRSGARLVSARYEPRRLRVTVDVIGRNGTQVRDYYTALAEALRLTPGRDSWALGVLQVVRNDGSVRALDCAAVSGLEIEPVSPSFFHRLPIVFIAPRPFWYDPVQKSVSRIVSWSGMGVPTGVPTGMGISSRAAEVGLDYVGSASTWSLGWLISGPCTNPALTHITSGRRVKIETTIPTGSTLLVTMGYLPGHRGEDFTVEQAGVSQIDKLSFDSYPLYAEPGADDFRHTQDNDDENEITLRHYAEYLEG